MMEDNTSKCAWGDLFDHDDKLSLRMGYFHTGFFSVALGLWLNLSIVLTDLWHDPSYRNLSNFTRTALVRRVITFIPFRELIVGRSGASQPYCSIFAFLDMFLAVFEIEWLTHVCIERYVVAKYVTKGWPMSNRHYTLFMYLCVFFATLYATLPLFGFGGYGLEFSCNYCTFDMILPDSWQRYSVVIIYFLCSIKPTLVMLTMLVWACILEDNLKTAKESYERRTFTRNMIIITLVNLFCWTPIAVLRGGVVLSQLVYSHPVVLTSAQCIKWAMWLQWASPSLNVITLFIVDKKARNKMLLIPYYRDDKSKIDDQKNK